MKVADNVLGLIGQTPIVRLNNLTSSDSAEVYIKLEGFNPAGSIKDRPALRMIEKAEELGLINQDSVILEATSGNTGIGLAMVCCVKGYRLCIVMPENMSEERKKILKALGTELILTPASQGMPGAVARAKELAAQDNCYYPINQFDNPANAEAHALTTAQEILAQMGTKLDAVVCGVGSGGTITGLGQTLKEYQPELMLVAVEPSNSAVISGQAAGPHKIQGIGAGFVPPVLNTKIIDKIAVVKDEEAICTCRALARQEAVLVGISSGAVVFSALKLARELGPGHTVLAIAADGIEKYMSTELFNMGEDY